MLFQDLDNFFHSVLLRQSLTALAVALLGFFVLQGLKSFVQRRIAKSGDKTPVWSKDLIDRTRWPVRMIMGYLAIATALQTAPLLIQMIPNLATVGKIIWILLSIWLIDRLLYVLIKHSRLPASFTSSTRTLMITIHRVVIFGLGSLVILDTLGISITPILASLGVGSVAVALALQDTLSNFFSGVYILMDRPIRAGDYIRVDDKIEGYVIRIGWRSTHIGQLGNNTIIMPNSKLSSASVMNYNMPSQETSISVNLGVAYESDLELVERVTLDVAGELIRRMPEAVPTSPPSVRFNNFGDSSIDFSVSLRSRRYEDSFVIKHEFIKALQARYKKEGIDIPFPQRVLHMAGTNSPNKIQGER